LAAISRIRCCGAVAAIEEAPLQAALEKLMRRSKSAAAKERFDLDEVIIWREAQSSGMASRSRSDLQMVQQDLLQ
jgi:hypothetical protein